MPTLKEVLADRQTYADGLVWQLGNGVSVTLGQLRSLDGDRQSAITTAEQKLATDRAALDTSLAEHKRAQTNAANLYSTLNQAVEAIRVGRYDDPAVKQLLGNTPVIAPNGTPAGTPDPFAALAALERDSLLGPVVTAIKAISEQARKANDAVNGNLTVQKKMAENYMNGVLEDRYDRLVPTDKQTKYSLENLIIHAVKANQFYSDTTPNIRWAYKELSAAETKEAEKAQITTAAEDALLKTLGITREQYAARQAAGAAGEQPREIFIPTPQTFGLDVHNRSGAAPKPFKSLDAAFEAAERDPEIWRQVDQLAH